MMTGRKGDYKVAHLLQCHLLSKHLRVHKTEIGHMLHFNQNKQGELGGLDHGSLQCREN